jgi:hypothetical protein
MTVIFLLFSSRCIETGVRITLCNAVQSDRSLLTFPMKEMAPLLRSKSNSRKKAASITFFRNVSKCLLGYTEDISTCYCHIPANISTKDSKV